MRKGFTCSTFDLLHAGHIDMLRQAKDVCDYLICGLQVDPSRDRPHKNRPIQSIVERQVQLKAVKYVDEVIVYETEKDLEDILSMLDIDVRVVGEEYRNSPLTGRDICNKRGIDIFYNERSHGFSSSELRRRLAETDNNDLLVANQIGTVDSFNFGLDDRIDLDEYDETDFLTGKIVNDI